MQPEPGFEVVDSFRPGYPRHQMALRGLASRGLICRAVFDLPEIHQIGGSKERRKSINIILPFRLNIDSTFYDVDGRYYV
jgi:hypothetical protein